MYIKVMKVKIEQTWNKKAVYKAVSLGMGENGGGEFCNATQEAYSVVQ